MFKLIEAQLKVQGKTKVWFADALNESTQNINNWKKRGVPASKVKRISEVLGVSRDYLEDEQTKVQRVASTGAEYALSSAGKRANYQVFVDIQDQKLALLLKPYLKVVDGLTYLSCAEWSYSDPFVAVDICQESEVAPLRMFLRHDCIVGISESSRPPSE